MTFDVLTGRAPDTGLRERLRTQTRADISRAAIRLASERGIAEVTVAEIAAEAGVSPRTFFNYFPTKRDALLTWVPTLDEAALEQVADSAQPLRDALRTLLVAYAEAVQEQREAARRIRALLPANPEVRAGLHERFRELESDIAGAVARRLTVSPEEVTPRALAALGTSLLRVAFSRWLAQDDDASLTAEVTAAFRAVEEVMDG